MIRICMPFCSESDSSASGDRLIPCERANLTGFSCQPFTVLTIASMSRAVITIEEQEEKKKKKEASACVQRTFLTKLFQLVNDAAFTVYIWKSNTD